MTRSAAIAVLLLAPAAFAGGPKSKTPAVSLTPGLEMDGGRRLLYERAFSSERELKPKRSFFTKLVDLVAGAPDMHYLVRPYDVIIDSHGRVLISDPGARGIHIIDFAQQKYKFLSHPEGKDPLLNPQCLAADKQDSIYVTDPEAGKVFVFNSNGKYERAIGSLRGGEGFFKHPTGIAVDSDAQRIYVSDTWRNRIFVTDMQGQVIQTIGRAGRGDGEFAFPTQLRLIGNDLAVVDSMNFRVQVLSREGVFRYSVGKPGDGIGALFRPKGVSADTEGHLYITEDWNHLVQVYDDQGRLLYYFGYAGTTPNPLLLPAGLSIDGENRIYVADSAAGRLQIFHYYGGRNDSK